MILIGQYDSPFVRRTGIAMRLYGLEYEHRAWSTFGEAAKVRAYNPLGRVPTLVLEDGVALSDSSVILAHLDELVGVERALMPPAGAARLAARRRASLCVGLCEKAVALVYERVAHEVPSGFIEQRVRGQMGSTLDVLEAERRASAGFWFGDGPGHDDIALGCAARFIGEAHPGMLEGSRHAALLEHSARCEALQVFQEISQVFDPPK